MAIPEFVLYEEESDFTSCARDSCNGTVEKSESLAAKLNIAGSAVFVCRSCGAPWKESGGRLKYVRGSCDDSDVVDDGAEYTA